jgi:hypothetical protein
VTALAAVLAHEQADVRNSSGDPVFALPDTRFGLGPDLPVHVRFDTAGTCRLWGGSGSVTAT